VNAHATASSGVRLVDLPPTPGERRALAAKMRAAIAVARSRVSSDTPGYPRERFESARHLAALVEHCGRLFDGRVPVAPPPPKGTGSPREIVVAAASLFDVPVTAVRVRDRLHMRRIKSHPAARHVAMWCLSPIRLEAMSLAAQAGVALSKEDRK